MHEGLTIQPVENDGLMTLESRDIVKALKGSGNTIELHLTQNNIETNIENQTIENHTKNVFNHIVIDEILEGLFVENKVVELVEKWIGAKVRNDRTVKTYNCNIKPLLNYMNKNGLKLVDISKDGFKPFAESIEEMRTKPRHLKRDITEAEKKPLKQNTKMGYIRAASMFLHWLSNRTNFHYDIYNITFPELDKDDPNTKKEYLNTEKQTIFMNCFDLSQPVQHRDFVICELLISYGFRLSEISPLTYGSICTDDPEQTKLKFKAKAREMPQRMNIDEDTHEIILNYLKTVKPLNEYQETDPLFIGYDTRGSNQINTKSIHEAVYRAFIRCGFKTDCRYKKRKNKTVQAKDKKFKGLALTPHSLRHSFAWNLSQLMKDGHINLLELSVAMRHKSIDVTRAYLRSITDEFKETFTPPNWKDKLKAQKVAVTMAI